ncbi:hypothetical protein [Tahibacter amnicola]|uniref:DUF349 domain-containing protein n=1 Tax=Tahibacter amnicola TaxID=2976241 RepID=A0ABY6BJW3_9GAMM|nr:hypothetical protein [Tahibacter amnicola]UXI69757.1 hypothetical protein N4264_09035 [Tahibacter amnicola]
MTRDRYDIEHNIPLFCVIAAAHLAWIVWIARPDLFPAWMQPRAPDAVTAPVDDADGRAAPAAPAAPSPPVRDPRREIEPARWAAAQERMRRHRQEKAFGERTDDILARPEKTVRKLVEEVRRLERPAEEALSALERECASVFPDPAAPFALPSITTLAQGLDDDDRARIRLTLQQRLAYLQGLQRRCAALRANQDAWREAHRQFRATTGPDEREHLEAALRQPPEPDRWAELLQRLKQFWQQHAAADAGMNVVRELLASENAEERQWGLALLQRLADGHDAYVPFLAEVISKGYGRQPALPEHAQAAVERAAHLGTRWAIDSAAARARNQGDVAGAWAWIAWRLWLDAQGCYTDRPDAPDQALADDLQTLAALDRRLTLAARQQAGARYATQVADHGERARRFGDCHASQ